MTYESTEDTYFNWLCAKVLMSETPSQSYWNLFKVLHETEFVWVLIGDDNRAEDGRYLRTEFENETNLRLSQEFKEVGCSIFEMLIPLARRAAFQTEMSTQQWFWELISNLGLSNAYDGTTDDPQEVTDILYTLVWRTYNYDGKGGLFPLNNPPKDQREVEIWYQLSEYLVDHDIY